MNEKTMNNTSIVKPSAVLRCAIAQLSCATEGIVQPQIFIARARKRAHAL